MVHVFTTAARNYLGKVRTLAHSIKIYHPEFKFHFVVADRAPTSIRLEEEPFDCMIAATELEPCRAPSWLFCHSIVELNTAIKGAAAQRLLRKEGAELLLFFDPDTVLFSRIDDILEELRRSSLVLTPHLFETRDHPRGYLGQ